MKNLEKLPTGEKIQKDMWRESLLLNGRTGIEMGYMGNIEGVHHFMIEYADGYRGFHYSDEEIEEKVKVVISHIPQPLDIRFNIVRHR